LKPSSEEVLEGQNRLKEVKKMAHKYLKDAGIAAIALVSSFGVAQAEAPTPPPSASELTALIKPNADGSLPQRGRIILKDSTRAAAALTLGWNFDVCTASFVSSPNALFFTVFARNADGTVFFESTNLRTDPVQNELVAACQHAGRGYWIHIINTATLFFDTVLIFFPEVKSKALLAPQVEKGVLHRRGVVIGAGASRHRGGCSMA
jgi:hypothetical protein